jgi:hypothetical protein
VQWTTPKGYRSKGILYKPEDFDPTKKYPMIAYFYEKLAMVYTLPGPCPYAIPPAYLLVCKQRLFGLRAGYQL